ncbi:helix-turn-helix domain-containing protein [Ruegeria pomeroyi]|nr:helix-turn-helix domain-containing protein [Ruegeria pomeroyi]MCE8531566.1 helix-turn-helix domain-containing protein [Ruegeria pomeroyi]
MINDGIAFNRALQLQPFLELFERLGGNTDRVLRAAHLESFDLSDPATLITGNALYRAEQEMADALGDPYFAARAAAMFVEAGPVFVRESFKASRTLAEFLPRAILEIDRQISNIRYSLEINADSTVILGKRTFTPSAPIIQADAALASIWVTLLRLAVAQEFDRSRILIVVQEDAGIPPDLVPKPSILKQKWNGVKIRFPTEWLQRPLELNWKIPSAKRGEFDDISRREAIKVWLEIVCHKGLCEGSFGMKDLAHRLDVHPKSLQRTFTWLGTSFQKTRDNVRKQKALEILGSERSMKNEEIAEMLGFSNAPSFSRAFKRWTGVTPTEFRLKL